MANTIALAKAYLKDAVGLNEVAKASLLTGDLEANQVKFIGANTVELPHIDFGTELGDYSRATGFEDNDINLSWKSYTLTQDKGNSLRIDAMDDEEALGAGLVPYVNQFIRLKEVPHIDAYRLNVLADGAGSVSEVETINKDTAVSQILAGFTALDEAEFEGERILYITPTINSLFQTSGELARYINVEKREAGDVNIEVRTFNGAKIVVVPSSRFPANVNFLLVDPTAQLSVIKHRPAHYYGVGQVPKFDGAQVDMRLYHDTFVLEPRAEGIYKSISA